MALLSSDFDRGENTDVLVVIPWLEMDVHTADDIDPDESSNIRFFVAFECTQAVPHSR